jgi:hypothetical protein
MHGFEELPNPFNEPFVLLLEEYNRLIYLLVNFHGDLNPQPIGQLTHKLIEILEHFIVIEMQGFH